MKKILSADSCKDSFSELFMKISICQKTVSRRVCSETGVLKDVIQEVEIDPCFIQISDNKSLTEVTIIFKAFLPNLTSFILTQLKNYSGRKAIDVIEAREGTKVVKSKLFENRPSNTGIKHRKRVNQNNHIKQNRCVKKYDLRNFQSLSSQKSNYLDTKSSVKLISKDDDVENDVKCESPVKSFEEEDDVDAGHIIIGTTAAADTNENTVTVKNKNILSMLKSKIETQNPKYVAKHTTSRISADKNKLNSLIKRCSKNAVGEYVCGICEKSVTTMGSLRRHLFLQHINLKKKSFSCQKCQRVFTNLYSLRVHKTTHTNQLSTGKFLCEFCKKLFKSRSSYLVHARDGNCGRPVYTCVECGKTFTQESTYRIHQRKKHEIKNGNFLKCNKCNQLFTSKNGFRKHKRKATCMSRFICGNCGKIFQQSNLLKAHLLTHTSENHEKGFRCSKCSRRFATQYGVKRHAKLCVNIKDKSTSSAKFPTAKATDQFQPIDSMHSINSRSKYICEICGNSFSQSSSLHKHSRSHSNIRPFKCSYCEKSFRDKFGLKVHTRIHTREKPYLCNDCGKAFICNSKLLRHMRSHEKQKHDSHCKDERKSSDTVPVKKRRNERFKSRIDRVISQRVTNVTKNKFEQKHSDKVDKQKYKKKIEKGDGNRENIDQDQIAYIYESFQNDSVSVGVRNRVDYSNDTSFHNFDNVRHTTKMAFQTTSGNESWNFQNQNVDLPTNPTIYEIHRENYFSNYNSNYNQNNYEYANQESGLHTNNMNRIENNSYLNNNETIYVSDGLNHLTSDQPINQIPHNTQSDMYCVHPPPPPYPGFQCTSNQIYLQGNVAHDNEFSLIDLNRYLPNYDLHDNIHLANNDLHNTHVATNNDLHNTHVATNNDLHNTHVANNNDLHNTRVANSNDLHNTHVATNNDLHNTRVATNNDLHNTHVATNNDLHNTHVATNNDLHNTHVATNNDLHNTHVATNNDLHNTHVASNNDLHTANNVE